MSVIATFIGRVGDHWILLLGIMLMIEPLLDYYWAGYRDWADRYIRRETRTWIFITLSVLAIFIANFLAFEDEFNSHQRDLESLRKVSEQIAMAVKPPLPHAAIKVTRVDFVPPE